MAHEINVQKAGLDNSHLIRMYLELEQQHSETLMQHTDSIEVNRMLKNSIASLERALAEARKGQTEFSSTDAEELEQQNWKLRQQIQCRAKQLRDIYTGRYQNFGQSSKLLTEATHKKAASAIERELESAIAEHEQLKQDLQAAQQELSQERRHRVRTEGELKSLEYRQARPSWSRAIRADRLPSSPSRLLQSFDLLHGSNP